MIPRKAVDSVRSAARYFLNALQTLSVRYGGVFKRPQAVSTVWQDTFCPPWRQSRMIVDSTCSAVMRHKKPQYHPLDSKTHSADTLTGRSTRRSTSTRISSGFLLLAQQYRSSRSPHPSVRVRHQGLVPITARHHEALPRLYFARILIPHPSPHCLCTNTRPPNFARSALWARTTLPTRLARCTMSICIPVVDDVSWTFRFVCGFRLRSYMYSQIGCSRMN